MMFLIIPAASKIVPNDINITAKLTNNISLNIPIVSAAMDTITEKEMAIALAQEGGIGIIHKNMSVKKQASQVQAVKNFESGVIKNPFSLKKEATVEELKNILKEKSFSSIPIIENDGKLIGIVTARDIRFCNDNKKQLKDIMTKDLITAKSSKYTKSSVLNLLNKKRIEKVPIVDSNGILKALITAKDLNKYKEHPLSCKDKFGQLIVGAAVGVNDIDKERVHALNDAGVDVIVVDTAHGHSKFVIDQIKWIKTHYKDLDVIGGNIATRDAAEALISAGVNGVKVGIGPGSICTTRIISGVGVPQLTAINDVAKYASSKKIPVIADGGIRFSGDACKAIAIGANCVMLGNMLAGTDEAPGEMIIYQGRSYKSYRGMGSLSAMIDGSKDRYFQDKQKNSKLIPEGVEGLISYKGNVLKVLEQIIGGVKSGMGYAGAKDINTLFKDSKLMKITPSTVNENHAHDVTITKESPNYFKRQI